MRLGKSAAVTAALSLTCLSFATAPGLAASIDDKTAQKQAEIPTCSHKIGSLAVHEPQNRWWVGLGLMHTLFTLEHNSICDRLKQEYANWTDERLFQTARLINAALMAKIHTVEWTPPSSATLRCKLR